MMLDSPRPNVALSPAVAAQKQSDSISSRRKRRSLQVAIIALVVIALAGGGLWAWRAYRAPATIEYATAPATRGLVERAVTATGTVNPELTIIVGTYVSGVIQQLFCDYNTPVKVGQICAKIDPRPYQATADQAKANLSVAKAQLQKDKANLDYTAANNQRYQLLLKEDSTSKDAAEVAKNAYDQALAQVALDEATVDQMQAALALAQVNLDYTNIVSPVDGVVVSRNVTQGQTVAATLQTPTLFLIATDLTRMEVDTNVSESDIGGVKQGDVAKFTVDAYSNRAFEGTVTQVRQSPQTVQNVVTYDAVVTVDNRDSALMPGMTASTRIVVDRRVDALRIPNQALRFAPANAGQQRSGPPSASTQGSAGLTVGAARVWVLRNRQPMAAAVVVGLEDDNFTEIVGGDLRAGDEVIVGERQAKSDRALAPSIRF
jgi:HlyD family secretion protein